MQPGWRKSFIATCAAALMAGAAAVPALAAGAHSHDHDAFPRLTLNQGKQWGTDAPLRQGMSAIRRTVEPQLERVHAGKVDQTGYARMAADIEAQVAYIVGNCKLDLEADAVLHAIIAELGEGVDALQAREHGARPERGMVKIVSALNNYGKYFDHPGWKPVAAGH
ncbi:MAG: hypothetical protein KJ025_22615 [Burkholderiales bacterium]|nr:hypothetical protein [Burkholderiales bacterium]